VFKINTYNFILSEMTTQTPLTQSKLFQFCQQIKRTVRIYKRASSYLTPMQKYKELGIFFKYVLTHVQSLSGACLCLPWSKLN
jgi:hypothetical protein